MSAIWWYYTVMIRLYAISYVLNTNAVSLIRHLKNVHVYNLGLTNEIINIKINQTSYTVCLILKRNWGLLMFDYKKITIYFFFLTIESSWNLLYT